MAGYEDLVRAGLLGPTSQRDAALQGLFALGGQIGRRSAPRLTPTPPPLDLGAPMRAYQASMTGALQRGALARKLRDEEEKRAQLERQRALFASVAPDPAAAQLMAAQAAAPLAQGLAREAAEKTMARPEEMDPAYLGHGGDLGDTREYASDFDLNRLYRKYKDQEYPAALESETERLLPDALKATTVAPALRAVPANIRPLVQQLAAAGLTPQALKIVSAELARKPKEEKWHNVLVNNVPRKVSETELKALDDGGADLRPIPRVGTTINVDAGRRAGEKLIAKNIAQAAIGLPAAVMQAKKMNGLIDMLLAHKSFSNMVGFPENPFGPLAKLSTSLVPGSAEAEWMGILKQITGELFMVAYKTLKGGGQITEVEGLKATQAAARLGETNQDEAAYRRAAQEIKDFVDETLAETKRLAARWPTPGQTSRPPPSGKPRRRRLRYNMGTGKMEEVP